MWTNVREYLKMWINLLISPEKGLFLWITLYHSYETKGLKMIYIVDNYIIMYTSGGRICLKTKDTVH